MKKQGFTLAEVLVTLGIIGVISAITVPALKKNAEMKELAVGCKKAYSVLTQATNMLELKYGQNKRWLFKDGSDAEINRMMEYYTSVMNVTKKCPSNSNGCWTQIVDMTGKNYGASFGCGTNIASFTTADGMNFSLDGTGSMTGLNSTSAPSGSLGFWVDVNGNQKPNMLGYDVFFFVLTNDRGIMPDGADNNSADCVDGKPGISCAAKVLKEGKISY